MQTPGKIEPGSFEEQAEEFKWKCIPDSNLPNVLILGDSISIGYTLVVRKLLTGKANVFRPIAENGSKPENCGDTGRGMQEIGRWLGVQENTKWDIIHFNWGLHDLKRISPEMGLKSKDPSVPPLNSIDIYVANLERLVQEMKKSGARLIFATTTPYVNGVTPCRIPQDALLYNQAALEIMPKYDVAVNDLYSAVLPHLDQLQRPVNVHFTPEGSSFLGKKTAEFIMQYL